MNAPFQFEGRNPFEDEPIDRILAEIALSAQLPPSLHGKARGRYRAAREHLEADPAFDGQIEHFYPQGSMAIDATISSRGTDDEYDLDIVSQLGGHFRTMPPLEILTEVERALSDYPVAQIVRQTRCVTLYYSDNMHLDITPAIRAYGALERESFITHAKGPKPGQDDRFVDMNAFGFAAWYRDRTPIEMRLAKAIRDHLFAMDGSILAEAEVDEVPDQCDFAVKNTSTLALQLLKRFRNIRYATYTDRVPPSVMLSYFAGMAASPNMSLSEMLVRQANWIIDKIETASLYRQLLHVANPVCAADVFTDRWPATVEQQNEFAGFLKELVGGIQSAKRGDFMSDRLMEWLRECFGARVVTKAADRIAREVGDTVQAATHGYTRRGGLYAPAAASAAAVMAPSIVRASPHTFFGVKI